ncbi:unnamed protein product [Sphagnum jensenii]|uniref:Uncharacterized protein n=1 Tax=Sphagnum jensenii TaxID=128206 RepID=A0ABP0VK83_9BRYO
MARCSVFGGCLAPTTLLLVVLTLLVSSTVAVDALNSKKTMVRVGRALLQTAPSSTPVPAAPTPPARKATNGGPTSSTGATKTSTKSTSKTGMYIGIAVACAVVLLLIVCLVCRFCTERRFKRSRFI